MCGGCSQTSGEPRNNWPVLQCEPQLSCSRAPAAETPRAPAAGPTTHACAASMLLAKHVRARDVKNWSVDERATGFTKSAKWDDCDSVALLLWHMLIARNPPMLWYVKQRAPHVGLSSQLFVRGDFFPGGRRRRENHSCSTRHNRPSRSTGTLSSLGRFSAGSIATLSNAAAKKELGETGKKWPLVRHGPDQALNSALGTGQETQKHVTQGQLSPRVGAPGQLLSSDRRTTRPPCTRAQSHQAGVARPLAPGHQPRVVRSGC